MLVLLDNCHKEGKHHERRHPPLFTHRPYPDRLPSLREKKAACFVTQHFKSKWMGSTRALKQLTNVLEQKGASVLASGIAQWSSKDREEQIRRVADQLSRI